MSVDQHKLVNIMFTICMLSVKLLPESVINNYDSNTKFVTKINGNITQPEKIYSSNIGSI